MVYVLLQTNFLLTILQVLWLHEFSSNTSNIQAYYIRLYGKAIFICIHCNIKKKKNEEKRYTNNVFAEIISITFKWINPD